MAAIGGLPAPAGVDGVDVSSLLAPSAELAGDKALNTDASVVVDVFGDPLNAAYHQYPACGCSGPGSVCFHKTRAGCNNTPRNKFGFMGYTMRTATWRYTAWFAWMNNSLTPDWDGEFVAERVLLFTLLAHI